MTEPEKICKHCKHWDREFASEGWTTKRWSWSVCRNELVRKTVARPEAFRCDFGCRFFEEAKHD